MQSIQNNLDREIQPSPVTETQLPELRAVDLRKSFVSPNGSRIEVLRGASLEVRAGEAIAIVGASGSGKSTLLHLLGGLDQTDHGLIWFEDTELTGLSGQSKAHFRRKHFGFVFQFHYLMNDLTALENVALPLLIARRSLSEARIQASKLLNEFGVENRKDHGVSQLSGGEQQRVALARALVHTPRLLLADEPTGNLDAQTGDEIGQAIVEYVRRNRSIGIIATHNEALARLCNRILVLENGRLLQI
jgi:lipoprotein-releasing system ATP-binding protein